MKIKNLAFLIPVYAYVFWRKFNLYVNSCNADK